VIARSSVSRTWLSRTVATAKCVTIPSSPPTTVQPSTRLGRRSAENEMSIPCTNAPGSERISQSRISTFPRRTWIPSSSAPSTTTSSSSTLSAPSTSIPFWPPRTVTLRTVTSSAVITIPPSTTVPSSPSTVCAWSSTSGPWCTPAASRTVGGSTAHARPSTATSVTGAAAASVLPVRPSSPPSSAQLSLHSGSAAWASSCSRSQAPAKKPRAAQSGGISSSARTAAMVSASSSSPSGSASQPGW
jgi:hypothetical protein